MPRTKLTSRMTLAFTLVVGLGLTLTLFAISHRTQRELLDATFERMSNNRVRAVKKSLHDHERILESVADFYAASNVVEANEFETFVVSSFVDFPSLLALFWVPRSGTQTSPHYLVRYAQPKAAHEQWHGFDFAKQPAAVLAMAQASAEDKAVGACVTHDPLAQEKPDQLLVFLPIYRKGLPTDTPEARQKNILGYVAGLFDRRLLFAASTGIIDTTDLRVRVSNVVLNPASHPFHSASAKPIDITFASGEIPEEQLHPHPPWHDTFEWAHENWDVQVEPMRQFFAKHSSREPWEILGIGLSLTALVAVLSTRKDQRLQVAVGERRRAESALQQLMERFDLAVRGSNEGLWDGQLSGTSWEDPENEVWYSPRFKQLLGYTDAEFPNRQGSWIDHLHPDDRQAALEALKKHIDHRAPFDVETRMRTKSGEYRWFSVRGQGVWDLRGRPVRFAGSVRDITDRKRAEEALRFSEERFRQLAENVRATFWMTDPAKQEMLYVSPAYEEIWGRPCQELYTHPKSWIDAIHPDDRGRVRLAAHHRQMLGTYDEEYRIIRSDGTIRWIRDRAFPIRDEHGEIYRICGVAEDITTHKEIQEKLVEQTRILQSVLDNMVDGVVVVDEEENFLFFNPAAEQILGTGPSNEKSPNWSQHYHLYMSDRVTPFPRRQLPLVRALSGEEIKDQEMFILQQSPDRSKPPQGAWISVNASPLKDESGVVRGGVAVFRDISSTKHEEERRQHLEERLRQSQKMEAIGTLAGGIAHDFNNMLSGILGNTDLLKLFSKQGDDVYESADAIERAARRSADLTKQLLGFARRGKQQSRVLNLREITQEVCNFFKRALEKSIVIEQIYGDNNLFIAGDPDQIHQVILNLLVNARDAMPKGGKVTLECRKIQREDEPGRQFVRLSVSDSGTGIPQELHDRIFEPFFTTKEPGKGTGMGLAMVYGIVKAHNGHIAVCSKNGEGACFEVDFPVAEGPLAPEASRPHLSAVPGSGCILLVDDEEIVRETAVKMLKQLGYDVLTACDGREAVERYRECNGDIDLALIDLVMPNMGGRECFRELKKINPAIKAVLVTGYGVNTLPEDVIAEGMLGYVQKPYQMAQISEIVAKIFAAQA